MDFKTTYTSNDDIIEEFFKPAFRQYKNTKICSAYFSSSMLLDLFDEISNQLENGGTFSLIIGDDTNPIELEKMQALARGEEGIYIIEKLFKNISKDNLEKYKVLMHYIENSSFIIKVGKAIKTGACFHNKLYIFHDSAYDMGVAASGSLNFTRAGLYDNYENIVLREKFGSFMESMREFEGLWNNSLEGTSIKPILDFVIQEIDYKIDNLPNEMIDNETLTLNDVKREIRPYQQEAIDSFFNNNLKGILCMATGSGKTFTAINIIKQLTNKTNALPIICVPYKVLAEQWRQEIGKVLPNKSILVCNSENPDWQMKIGTFLRRPMDKVIIVVNKTYSGEYFSSAIKNYIDNIFLIVDEVHNFKSENLINNCYHNFPYRLALSATPYSDDEENVRDNKLEDYFDGIVYTYSLKDAIKSKFLVEYKYYYTYVNLNFEEYQLYNKYSSQIAGLIENGHDASALITKRNSLIANCEEKLVKFEQLCANNYYPTNTIVYCGKGYSTREENKRVISEIASLIVKNNRSLLVQKFTSDEKPHERIEILESFTSGRYHFLTAMKCLDEGVDIPSVKNVIILASENTTREWVQRRGRVLRLSEGKEIAIIYDFIVCSPNSEVLEKENARKEEFMSLAKESHEY